MPPLIEDVYLLRNVHTHNKQTCQWVFNESPSWQRQKHPCLEKKNCKAFYKIFMGLDAEGLRQFYLYQILPLDVLGYFWKAKLFLCLFTKALAGQG